jgi:hypothetical protein
MRIAQVLLFFLVSITSTTAARSGGSTDQSSSSANLADLNYQVYPRRTEEEAAVLEWGHSAIISALDASVALFGPQTSQAALLEVECQPILASPLNGVGESRRRASKSSTEEGENEEESSRILRPLDNADEVHGNMVVMTNNGDASGVEMAKIAKLSGAAALLVVNIDEVRPDDIFRLVVLEGENADDVDIPVVMISLNSANVLTTATVTPDMKASEIVNHGMPERVRLYAGGDRPFFEDVEPIDPTLYLIHNLLTSDEASNLVEAAQSKVSPLVKDDILQLSYQSEKFHKVQRTMLWTGMLQTPASKAIEERIEQVTGFPASHYSDFVIDRLDEEGAHWKPHYDTHPNLIPMATITVFLTGGGGSVVYPSCREPVEVIPRKGMAIVHHNTNEKHELDLSTVHAMMPAKHKSTGPIYVARKYVFTTPVSTARRLVVPVLALPLGGKLPGFIVSFHDLLVERFGVEDGSFYFDKACIFVPVLFALLLLQYISEYIQGKVRGTSAGGSTEESKSKSQDNKPGRKSKRTKKD